MASSRSTDEKPADYVFTRDFLDNNRINLQHYLWVELFGYHIHPTISTHDPHLRIADVGTGTGIWLTDLANRLPKSVQLDGLDISFDATPPQEWLPTNMTLRRWDVKEDPPEDLVSQYNILHIRNFAFVLPDHDAANSVLSRLIKLLKPGGHLQWAEPDVSSFRIEKTHPANQTSALRQLLELSQGQDTRLRPQWVPALPDLFANSGLEMVQSDVREAPPHLALAMHECNLLIHELVVRKTLNEGVAQGLREVMKEVMEETRAGSCWAFTRWSVTGRKPG